MNSGLNNQSQQFSQLTPVQMEELQQYLRSQQLVSNLMQNNMKSLSFPNLLQGFSENQNRTLSPLDLLGFNFGLGDAAAQMHCAKVLQKGLQFQSSALNPLLTNPLFYFNNLMPQMQKKMNNSQNPICVEDDEPPQVLKCHNQKCTNKGDRKTKSKKGDVLQFCEKCLRLYNRGNFCDFCEQIYFYQVYSNGSYDQDEQGWIQCDECEKWNHINCEAKFRNQNIKEETENKVYYCLNCTKAIKKQQQQQQYQKQKQEKVQEDYQPKQRQIIECEDNRTREKNINFVATKDNKVQFSKLFKNQLKLAFRLNLYDEEIRSDLDLLRNSGKKNNIKKQGIIDSPILKTNIIPLQQSLQLQPQEEKNSEQQINSRLRTRNNKTKVNYRYLGGGE